MLDFDLKERVRAAVDIVDVIGASLTLVPKGRMLAARCPWHDDRSPSLTVNRERQTWKCWVCDIGGDIFSYVMRRDGVDFPTALKLLADVAGIEYRTGPQPEAGSADDKKTLLDAVRLVCESYFQQLDSPTTDDAKIARDYLEKRGVDDETRRLFQVGFAPDRWDFATNLLKQKKFRPEIATAAGVALARRSGNGCYDLFRGRLMFPIHDLQNRPISMGGRIIPAIAERHGDKVGGKYINGPETKLFRKSHNLYGLQLARNAIRKSDQVMVMEGYTDVIAARQAGIEPVVAVLGTALGEDHIKLLNQLTQRVVLVLDGDVAGQTRADEVLELFVRADVDLRILTLPDGMDPADYLAEHGSERFSDLVDQSPDALEHKLHTLTRNMDVTNDTHGVMKAIDVMTSILAKSPNLDLVKQDQLLLRLSRKFGGISTQRLADRLEQKRREEKQRTRQSRSRPFTAAQGKTTSPGERSMSHPATDPNALLAEAAEANEFDESEFGGNPNPSDAFLGGADSGNAYQRSSSTGNASRVNESRDAPIRGVDRELFEVLIESPELVGRAVEAIDPDWLDSLTAKMILSAYQELELDGRDLQVESLLLLLENDTLKNEIVTMQFRVAQREGKIAQDADQRFHTILEQLRRRSDVAQRQRQIAMLESTSLNDDEELELLKQLFDGEKDRHQFDR